MILILGLAAGWVVGLIRSRIQGQNYRVPELKGLWLILAAVLPQLLIFQIPSTAKWFSSTIASAVLVVSQILLLVFIWQNRDRVGVVILGLGLLLNLLVITLNGGLMPISPETAQALYPQVPEEVWQIGTRPGMSKNILLPVAETRLSWLSDSILLPDWFPWNRALSPGDLLIVLGAFWLLAVESLSPSLRKEEPALTQLTT
jgi:hypothetical protein